MKQLMIVVLAGGVAAAEPKVCATAPADATAHALKVVAKAGVLVAESGQFPAISADGKRIAQLFVDRDAEGATESHVMIWRTADRDEIGWDGITPDIRDHAKVAERINKQLDGTWKALPIYKPCDAAGTTLHLPEGLAFTITLQGHDTSVTRTMNGKSSTRLNPVFMNLGYLGNKPIGAGGGFCGKVTRIEYGFGGPSDGITVLVPGGDLPEGCFVSPKAHVSHPYATH